MLYELCIETQAELTAQGYNLKVIFGEEGFDRIEALQNVALVKYAENGDQWVWPKAVGQVSKGVFRKSLGVDVRIDAVDTRTGAREQDHKRQCNHNVEAFIVALFKVCQRRKNYLTPPTLSKFRPRADTATSEYGAVYLMTMGVDCGISQTDMPTVTLTGKTSTVTTVTNDALATNTETCASP